MQLQLEVPKDLSERPRRQRAAEKEKLFRGSRAIGRRLARQVAGLGSETSAKCHGCASSIGPAPACSIDRIVALFALSWERQV